MLFSSRGRWADQVAGRYGRPTGSRLLRRADHARYDSAAEVARVTARQRVAVRAPAGGHVQDAVAAGAPPQQHRPYVRAPRPAGSATAPDRGRPPVRGRRRRPLSRPVRAGPGVVPARPRHGRGVHHLFQLRTERGTRWSRRRRRGPREGRVVVVECATGRREVRRGRSRSLEAARVVQLVATAAFIPVVITRPSAVLRPLLRDGG